MCPIQGEAENHQNSAVTITDVGKLALITVASKVDCDVIEETARARDHRGGKLMPVYDPLGLQGEEKQLGSKVGKCGSESNNRTFLFSLETKSFCLFAKIHNYFD